MTIDIKDKKRFLTWLITHEFFVRREVSWILNYLVTHDAILKQVHFVESAKRTPRGICVKSSTVSDQSITLFLNDRTYQDSDQIFHEIRFNWQEPLYLECIFPESWDNSFYLAVLEDNPYHKWNDSLDEEMVERVDAFVRQAEIDNQIQELYQKIDTALENDDQLLFRQLTEKVKDLMIQKEEAT
ncbi:YpiB family protein [Enterococcus sp. LJL98]